MKYRTFCGRLLSFILIFSVSFPALAVAAENSVSEVPSQRLVIGARAGFGMLDGDVLYRLQLNFLLSRPKWEIGLQLPLEGIASEVTNATPHYQFMGLIKAHWDDVGDIGRIIGSIRLGDEKGPAELQMTRLAGYSLFQETTVANIYTQINPDSSGLVINTRFKSDQGHSLGLLVVEPFNPALVILGGAVHPLAPWFGKCPNLSSLALSATAYIDPTIAGKLFNYGVGIELEESFFIKNIWLKPFNSYGWNGVGSVLGAGLEFGRRDRANDDGWQLKMAVTLLLGEYNGQAVGPFYLLERSLYPLLPVGPDYNVEENWPGEWHGSVKGSFSFILPRHLLIKYAMLVTPYRHEGEALLHLQSSFFDRWTLGAFVLAKKYGLPDVEEPYVWLAAVESAFNIWQGLLVSAEYSYLINNQGLASGLPVHRFLINIGFEFGRQKALD